MGGEACYMVEWRLRAQMFLAKLFVVRLAGVNGDIIRQTCIDLSLTIVKLNDQGDG